MPVSEIAARGNQTVKEKSLSWMIPNYAERRRYGERVSTGFVESAINTVECGGLEPGARFRMQALARALDGTLREKFEQWHPGLKGGDGAGKEE